MPRRKKQAEPPPPLSSAPSSNESVKQQPEPQASKKFKQKSTVKAPNPRGRPKGSKKQNKREQTPFSSEDYISENENDENCLLYDDPRQQSHDPPQPSGVYCRKHAQRKLNNKNAYAHIRTLYSKFPRDYFRLIFLNIMATFIIYLIVYPFINLIWSFFINFDDEVSTLFRYLSEEPTYESGFFSHCRKLRWLSLPPFSAEIASLIIAASIKDTVVLHWEGIMDDISLTEIVSGQIARRYRNHI